MKSLTIILILISSMAYGQQVKSQTVIFTDITVDQAGGGSFYMEYTDASGVTHYSDMRFEEDIYINSKLVYDYEDGLLVYFNEKHAKECIGKEMIVRYYDEEIKYFGVVPHVIQIEAK